MKHWNRLLALMVTALLVSSELPAVEELSRSGHSVTMSQEFTEESSSDLTEHDFDLFLELEILESLVNDESEVEEFENFLTDHQDDRVATIPIEAPWTWSMSNSKFDRERFLDLPTGEQQFNSRFAPARIGIQEEQYLAAAGLSGEVANVEIYTEFGMAGGQVSRPDDGSLSDEELETAIELDPSTYYIAGGANMGIGRWKLGVEAGYGSGAETSSSSQQSFSGLFEGSQLIGSQQTAPDSSLRPGSAPSLEEAPFKLVYLQGVANRNVTDNIGFNIGAICFAVPEEFMRTFEENTVNIYGLELFSDLNYQLSKSFKYSLYMEYSMADTHFEREDSYQILHKLEFTF